MKRALTHRLTQREQQAQARAGDRAMWPTVDVAIEWLQTSVRRWRQHGSVPTTYHRRTGTTAQPTATPPPEGWYVLLMVQRHEQRNQRSRWYSHKTAEGQWCKEREARRSLSLAFAWRFLAALYQYPCLHGVAPPPPLRPPGTPLRHGERSAYYLT
jgi:hypothetical protein